MLDIKLLRTETEKVAKALEKRGSKIDLSEFLSLDKARRETLTEVEALKNRQNVASKQIPALKKEGKDVAPVFEEMKEISAEIKVLDDKVRELDGKLQEIAMTIPNIPNERVPQGLSDEDNKVVRSWGEPAKFDFEPLPHWEIGEALGILDAETAGKVTGSRFTFYKGFGAKLERAVINFFLNTHSEAGYTEIFPPYMVNRNSMTGTGQLPKFEEDAFKVAGTDYFLIPTAEVPVTNMHKNEILPAGSLPLKYCAYSACFRAEAGSAGRDTRGLIRQHQFNKVELVKFADPENSYEELESLTRDAENVLQLLGLPYRVSLLCTGDMGFTSAMTYDLEVWMPSYNKYVEISSCSNFEDFQARRAGIKFRRSADSKPEFVHTLNGSGVAVGRTVAAILENYQNADGSVTVPEALRGFLGTEVIR